MPSSERPAVLTVAGMTCDACERRVSSALEGAGARSVHANWHTAQARFAWPAEVDEAALRGAVTDAGYRPGSLRIEEPGHPAGGGDVDDDVLGLGAGYGFYVVGPCPRRS